MFEYPRWNMWKMCKKITDCISCATEDQAEYWCFSRIATTWRIPTENVVICHYNNVIMSAMASHIRSLTIVCSTVYSKWSSTKTSKPRIIGLCEGNSPVADGFPAEKASNAEYVSIWWRHHTWIQWPILRPQYEALRLRYPYYLISEFNAKIIHLIEVTFRQNIILEIWNVINVDEIH